MQDHFKRLLKTRGLVLPCDVYEAACSSLAQLRGVRSGCCTESSTGRECHSLYANSHPASGRFWIQEETPQEDVLYKDSSRRDCSDLWHVFTGKWHHCKQFHSAQSLHLWIYPKLLILFSLHQSINSPADRPQGYSELSHWIQQRGTASSWQHSPSTLDRRLGEISPGWQKTASNGMLRTFLLSSSAVIRIKSYPAFPASLPQQNTLLPGKPDRKDELDFPMLLTQ